MCTIFFIFIFLFSQEVSIHLDISNNVLYEEEDGNSGGSTDEDDEPPPLPPPRLDSLKKQNGTQIMDRPLPSIPASVSLNEIYDNSDSIEEVNNKYDEMSQFVERFSYILDI